VKTALAIFADHVRRHAGDPSLDEPVPSIDPPGIRDPSEQRAAILAICDEIEALADRPDVRFADFEALQRKLWERCRRATPADLVSTVAYAFMARDRLD
jgi:hypothetical protein